MSMLNNMSDISREKFEKLFITTDMYVRFFDGKYVPRAINSNLSCSWKVPNQLNMAWSAWQASAEASQARIAVLEALIVQQDKDDAEWRKKVNLLEADNAKLREIVKCINTGDKTLLASIDRQFGIL